jgi:hypothetical protein
MTSPALLLSILSLYLDEINASRQPYAVFDVSVGNDFYLERSFNRCKKNFIVVRLEDEFLETDASLPI